MNATPHQAKYFAHALSCMSRNNDAGDLTNALMSAQVDLNPHQIEAALFALKNPLHEGVMLADEVGLGKRWRQVWCFASFGRKENGSCSWYARRPCVNNGRKNCAKNLPCPHTLPKEGRLKTFQTACGLCLISLPPSLPTPCS